MKYLIYVTKAKPYLLYVGMNEEAPYEVLNKGDSPNNYINEPLNGHIVAEFECDKVEEINVYTNRIYETETLNQLELLNKSCLTHSELFEYLGEDYSKIGGYAIHISNLKVFDRPFKLNELEYAYEIDYAENMRCDSCLSNCKCECCYYHYNMRELTKAPQNMCYVWYKGEVCVLISIRSNWVCKILNGEKTIEVRKKVLKEMIK